MMKSEKEKMLAGEFYNALDKQLVDERWRARLLLKQLNDLSEDQKLHCDRVFNSGNCCRDLR